jgi:hypothetical protein
LNVSVAFDKLAEVAIALGVPALDKHEGLWRHDLPGGWSVAVNGHEQDVDGVPPFHARLSLYGFPAGLINPREGIIVGGDGAGEDAFIAALEAELARLAAEKAATP